MVLIIVMIAVVTSDKFPVSSDSSKLNVNLIFFFVWTFLRTVNDVGNAVRAEVDFICVASFPLREPFVFCRSRYTTGYLIRRQHFLRFDGILCIFRIQREKCAGHPSNELPTRSFDRTQKHAHLSHRRWPAHHMPDHWKRDEISVFMTHKTAPDRFVNGRYMR